MPCHIVFSTKNWEPLVTTAVASRLFEYIGGICRTKGNVLLAAGGMPDHVHLLIALSKSLCVVDTVRDIKSNSSGWIHETFPTLRGFGWQTGYGAFAVSYSLVDQVKEYIGNQAEHHRVRTFQEEFVAFLKRHNVQYDERYLWE
jgi:REP element-mobilizing transposase RayT